MPYYSFSINLLGVVGGGGKSSGAFLGKPVTGIAALGSELANSSQFARCTVKHAFSNVFGRDPSGPDLAVIDRVSGEFTSRLKYDYNLMVEELVKTPEFMRGN
jgi:hypothetical protein